MTTPNQEGQSSPLPGALEIEKTKFEIEKDRLEAEKASLEIAELNYQARRFPRWMRLFGPALTAVLSLVVSTGAFLMSIRTQRSQGDLEHAIKEHEALRSDIEIATDGSKGRPRQVAGIWNLQRYLSTDERFIAASALGAVLGDDDSSVHNAVAGVIWNSVNDPDAKLSRELVKMFFGTKADEGKAGSWGIVSYQNHTMKVERRLQAELGSKDKNPQEKQVNKRDGTKVVIEACYHFLSGVDLDDADLSNTELEEADLSSSDLRGTDLSHANLRRADLRGVEIDDSTSFLGVNIFNAQASDDFREAALKNGAVEMDDASWQRWKKAGWPTPGNADGEEWVKWRNHKFEVNDAGMPVIQSESG